MADFLLSTPSLKAHWVEVEKEFLNNRIESILAMERKWAGGGKLVEFRDDEGQAQVAITPFGEAVVELLISVENRFGGVCEGLDDIKVDFQVILADFLFSFIFYMFVAFFTTFLSIILFFNFAFFYIIFVFIYFFAKRTNSLPT